MSLVFPSRFGLVLRGAAACKVWGPTLPYGPDGSARPYSVKGRTSSDAPAEHRWRALGLLGYFVLQSAVLAGTVFGTMQEWDLRIVVPLAASPMLIAMSVQYLAWKTYQSSPQ